MLRMKNIIAILLILITASAYSQNVVTARKLQLTGALSTDSTVTAGATVGIVRYDPITGKYRFWNALTGTWVSYLTTAPVTGSGSSNKVAYWSTSTELTYHPSFSFSTTGNTVTVENLSVSGIGTGNRVPHFQGSSTLQTDAGLVYNSGTDVLSTGGLTITNIPTNNNSDVQILARNSSSGVIEYVDKSTIGAITGSGTALQLAVWSGSTTLTGYSGITTNGSGQLAMVGFGSSDFSSVIVDDANTSSVIRPFTIYHNISGTAAINVGTGQQFGTELSNGNPFIMGSLDFVATNVTNGSQKSDFVIRNVLNAVTSEQLRLTSAGTLKLGTQPSTDNTNTNLLSIDGSGNIEIRTVASISTSPAGSDTQVQYNSSGSFGAESDFTYSATNNTIQVGQTAATHIELDDAGITAKLTGGTNYSFLNYSGIEVFGGGSFYITSGNAGSVGLTTNAGGDINLEITASTGDITLRPKGSGSYLILFNIPTSSAGLPSGAVWSNAGILTIVP